MKKIKKTFGERLEQLEIAKLRVKYEGRGYNFYENYRSNRKGELFIFDAYAKNPKTEDEIIFEVKSKESIQKGDTEKFLVIRDKYLFHFPKARFILVFAKEAKESAIVDSALNGLLAEYIKAKYLKYLTDRIRGFTKIENVEQISFANVNLKDFKNLEISGYGNIKFWLKRDDESFVGQVLSDGIPFQFQAFLSLNQEKLDYIYLLDERTEITFDLSEFN